MQLSLSHKFAFLCNPKCGSTSVEKAIRRHCEIRFSGHPSVKHITARKFERHVRPMLRKADPDRQIETFCILREPFEHLRSWYEYRCRAELGDPTHPRHKRYTGGIGFVEFLERYLARKGQEVVGIGSQAGFVLSPDKNIAVDRIFRLDQMEQVAEYLSGRIGERIEIPVANKSGGAGKHAGRELEDLPGELRARLLDHLADDYAVYRCLPWNSSENKPSPFSAG